MVAAIIRDMRNLRLSVIGVALVLTAVFGLLALLVSESLFLPLPVVLAAWFIPENACASGCDCRR